MLTQSTSDSMTAAAQQVTDELSLIFDAYGKGFDTFKADAIGKVKKLAGEIADALKNIDVNFGKNASLLGGSSNNVTNNNRTASVILNDYGNKNFNTKADMSNSWAEMSSLALYSLAGMA